MHDGVAVLIKYEIGFNTCLDPGGDIAERR